MEEFLAAQIASCVVNFGFCRPKEMVRPEQLMPSEWGKKGVAGSAVTRRPRMTRRRREKIADRLRAAFGFGPR
jgi:hypothetical protein